MDTTSQELLKFVPFSSCINPNFWFELNRMKLDEYMLNEDFKNITGFFNNCSNGDLPPIMNFDYSSFQTLETDTVVANQNRTTTVNGKLKVLNTINDFNVLDKNKLLKELGKNIWEDIKSGKALDNTELLTRFGLIAFANLKSYVFHYWFSFPAVTFPNNSYYLQKCLPIEDVLNQTESENFLNNLLTFNNKKTTQQNFFAFDHATQEVITVKEGVTEVLNSSKRIIFAFADPNSQSEYPGWPLRNLLALLSLHCQSNSETKRTIEVLSFRDQYKNGTRSIKNSLVFSVNLNQADQSSDITVIGWERNEKNLLQPKVVDMSGSMDTEKLAESAVTLNLKLMKWRIMPNIDLEVVKNQKCLLLGSGTLGCNVARCLLGWGVENITFVDNSKVSYSNPVRQSLFVFEDSINNSSKNSFKSLKAAENLKKIYPGVNAKGVVLSIPMPGHHVGDNVKSKIQKDVEELEKLIKEHDCIFLLMDTRESRWLPTLIAAANKKLVINSALGFDSFLVMRHGVKSDSDNIVDPKDIYLDNNRISGNKLGCYFCNDIVAPGNSTLDRTLDQQCTVSRPGLSMIASAISVELMATILQHPLKKHAHSSTNNIEFDSENEESCLGIIPHQMRGYLHSHSIIMPASQSFDKCTACSNIILETYEKEGFDFLMKAFNENSYLEDLSGLTGLKNALDENEPEFVIELSDSESW